MAFKFVIISCLVALVRAGNIPAAVLAEPAQVVAAPAVVSARLEEFDTVPEYRFGYQVVDTVTGDIKSQTEQRSGDLVQGEYSFIEADGSRRIVTYSADSVNGYNALVRNVPQVAEAAVVEPAVVEPAVVSARLTTAPVVPAAPVVPTSRYVSAPVFAPRYTAPFPAPLARYSYQPFPRFTAAATYAYPGTATQVVAA